MLKEFKEFALKGNMIDLAVGVIIGGAFNALVTSFVNDIIMPILSLLTKNIDFTNLFISLNTDGIKYETLAAAQEDGVATINYGLFISGILNFIIMAFVIFIVVKQINRLRRKDEPAAPITTKECPYCYTQVHIDATRCPHCTSEL